MKLHLNLLSVILLPFCSGVEEWLDKSIDLTSVLECEEHRVNNNIYGITLSLVSGVSQA